MEVRRRKIKTSRLMILVGAIVIVLFAIFLLFKAIVPDTYSVYRNISSENKLANETKIESEIKVGETLFTAYYYPVFEEESFNQEIMAYLDEIKKTPINEVDDVHLLDYQSSLVNDQFINVQFTFTALDEEGKELSKSEQIFNYDKKEMKKVEVKDLFRLNYLKQLQASAKNQLGQEVEATTDTLTRFIMEEKGVRFFLPDNQSFVFEYEANKRYVKVVNPTIPSLAPSEVIQPIERVIDPSKPMVAFTFDDGPTPGLTENLVDEFARYDGVATFFQLGSRIEMYPDTTKYVYENGGEIGNHSYDHPSLGVDDVALIEQQVFDTQDIVFKLLGDEIKLLRPTFGAISPTLTATIDMPMILWTIDTLDWKSRDMNSIINIIEPQITDGSIILMHDLYGSTVDAVKYLLPILSSRGYQFVTMSELLEYRP